jgi:hypothetical protein
MSSPRKYSHSSTTVKVHVDPEELQLKYLAATRGFTSTAWKLLQTLGTLQGYEPKPEHIQVFLDSVSRCKTALERSTLIILGEGVFRFDPSEAFDAVETLMLERMHALDGGRR